MTEKEVKDLSFLSATGDVNNSKKVRTQEQGEMKSNSTFQDQGDDVRNGNTVVDILSPAAMKNAYYICHNVQVKLI